MDTLQGKLELLRLVGDKVVAPGGKRYDEGRQIVGGSQSIVTFVKGINKALHADDKAFDKVPDDVTPVPVATERYIYKDSKLEERDSETRELLATYQSGKDLRVEAGFGYVTANGIERRVDLASGKAVELMPGRTYTGQLVFQYENSGKPEDIEGFIDNPRRTARVNIFIRSASSSVIGQVQDQARAIIASEFPKGSKADITGLSNLTLAILRMLVVSQIGSVLSSLVICFLFIALVAKNWTEGFFSIIPLSCSLIINFGIMAIFRIPIDISTATIASIGIGIGIDYTCHFIEGLKETLHRMDIKAAIEETMRTTGFAALLFSQLRGNIFMGLLMALIMITSSAFAVTLLPALLVLAKPSFTRKREIAQSKETT
jgi:predicted RND superfamily exporter protein